MSAVRQPLSRFEMKVMPGLIALAGVAAVAGCGSPTTGIGAGPLPSITVTEASFGQSIAVAVGQSIRVDG